MRAERNAAGTIKMYSAGVHAFLRWCAKTGTEPQLSKATAHALVADLLKGGAEGPTAHARLKGLRRFSAWLVAEGRSSGTSWTGCVRRPSTARWSTRSVTTSCACLSKRARAGGSRTAGKKPLCASWPRRGRGSRGGAADRRRGLDRGRVIIRRGKGGKGRVVPIGPQTEMAIDRYLRARRSHRLASAGPLWVGASGKTFDYYGLDGMLKSRAQAAGIEGFDAHVLRHTFATRWKAAQGSDDGLMAVAGWSSHTMIDRYARAAMAQRAAEEARALGLGNL